MHVYSAAFVSISLTKTHDQDDTRNIQMLIQVFDIAFQNRFHGGEQSK